jgi:hypothetical protein
MRGMDRLIVVDVRRLVFVTDAVKLDFAAPVYRSPVAVVAVGFHRPADAVIVVGESGVTVVRRDWN